MASRQKTTTKFERKCEICGRANENDRTLGPLVHTRTISAHYNCVLFSPVAVDATTAQQSKNDGICGASTRFIRSEGSRAKKLVIPVHRIFLWGTIRLSSFHTVFSYLHSAMQLLQIQWSSHWVLLRYRN